MSSSSPADTTIWIDDDLGNIGTVDVDTGATTVIGNAGVTLTDIAFNPSEQLFGASFDALYTVSQTTGAATEVGSFGTAGEINGLVFGSDGTLYGSGGSDLYTINTQTGAATLVGDLGIDGYFSAGDLAFDKGALYESADGPTGASDLLRVDPATGAATLVGQIVADPNVLGLVTGADGTLYGVDGNSLYAINTTDGVGTLVGSDNSNVLGTAFGAASPTESVPCYAEGTRILTQRGEIAVEELQVGDRAVALLGQGLARIAWLGHRTLELRGHPFADSVQPVRIREGAFGPGVPHRDLRVSPGHAVHVDGVLIQAIRLVNGATIVQEAVERVTYWHVELERHDVLLAEGLPAESYLDTGNRSGFVNGSFVEVHPAFRSKQAGELCAPLVENGPRLAAVRARLLARADAISGAVRTDDAGLHVVADGVVIAPCGVADGQYRFELPSGCGEVRLVSRVWVPSYVEPSSTDTRRLGVCVLELELDGVAMALEDRALAEGWHGVERNETSCWRWTSGAARLPDGVRSVTVALDGVARAWSVERMAA